VSPRTLPSVAEQGPLPLSREIEPDLSRILTVAELQTIAKDRLTSGAYVYVAGGAGDERTMRDNVEAFGRWRFMPRVLVDTSARTLSTSVLGHRIALPVGIAPFALQCLLDDEGEVAMARAATTADTFMALSMGATRTLEDVASAAGCPLWFQPYLFDDRVYLRELVQRAESAGYVALCLTVDSPVSGRRDGALRMPVTLPDGVSWANMPPQLRRPSGTWLSGGDAWTWKDVDRVRASTSLALVVKGVLAPADAALAVEHGARAIVVSNHGGRQLDDSIASLDALPAIVETVAGRAEVILDGGVRRGIDVLKALALGARAVLIGRAAAWGLAGGGQRGVERVLELLRIELSVAMAIAGVTSAEKVDGRILTRANTSG
jgi:4-hydroxymandelate oxidase